MSLLQLRPKSKDDYYFDEPLNIWQDLPVTLTYHGVSIKITKEGEVTLSGYSKLNFAEKDAEVDIVGKNVNIRATDTLSMGAKHHTIIDGDRIDLAPDRTDPDFRKHLKHGPTSL